MYSLACSVLSVVGLWTGAFEAPDRDQPIEFELLIEAVADDGEVTGSVAVDGDHSPVSGKFEVETGALRLSTDFDDDELILVAVDLEGGDRFEGTISKGDTSLPLGLSRSEGQPRFFHDAGLPLPEELPVTRVKSKLEPELGARVEERILEALREAHAVGASVVVARSNGVVDLRCVGWQDLARGIRASAETRYRWASVAKPMTAVAALQLVEKGRLDLAADVRDRVPEFPDKGHRITMHQLLAHHAGILHYGNGELIVTERETTVPHPSGDRILCLDRFAASPLIAEPGQRYSYSTYGYLLAGAVVERAGEGTFEEQVRRRVLEPLGMTTTVPDYPWRDVPHRAVGYRGLRIGLATLDEEKEVGWKLPAGGWTSTAEDLGRFAAGLLGERLLEPETRELMFTSKVPANGKDPGYGYGIGVWTLDGSKVVSHSGSQSMASSYLLLCPDEDLAVGVLSNTANLPARDLAQRVFLTVRDD